MLGANLPQSLGRSRLKHDISISPNTLNIQNVINLLGYLNTSPKLKLPDIDSLFTPDENFKTARELVTQAQLPDYEPLKWVTYSQTKFSLSEKKIFKTDGYKDILSKALDVLQPDKRSFVKIFFIGDYRSVGEFAPIIADSQLQYSDFDLDWNAFTPDPYAKNSSGTSPIVKAIQFYDDFVGQKWYCGEDNTGQLTRENLIWMVNNKNLKHEITIGLLTRTDYMSYSALKDDIRRYYNLLLALIASTKNGGTGILKMSIPNNAALDGIVSIFASFFSFIRVIKLKQDPPDDDTIYLIGASFNQNPNTGLEIYPAEQLQFVISLLSDETKLYEILAYMSKIITPYHQDLNLPMQKSIKSWVDQLLETWPSRNI